MDLSGISTSLNTQTLASPTAGSQLQPLAQDESATEVRREDMRGLRGRRGLALGILKQELRAALKSFFNVRIETSTAFYASNHEPDSPDSLAGEILGAARQVVAEAPTAGSESLAALRSTVEGTADYVRGTVAGDIENVGDVDQTTAIIGDGFDALSEEVADYREATASVLAVDTSIRERSTMQIRTQEGDFVKLYLRRAENMSATDIAYADGETSITSTEIALSSSSRTLLQVKGDLNESELTAIGNVIQQAEMIANEFFGGDVGAAFNSLQSSQFDTEQLARVDLRFRMQSITSATYAQVGTTESSVAAPDVAVAPADGASSTDAPEAAALAIVTRPPAEQVVAAQTGTPESDPPVTDDTVALPSVFSAMADFLGTLSAFLRSVGDGFEAENSSANVTYHYSESFKLNLLKAVINTVAPEEAETAAANAELVIDSLTADT